MPDEIRPLSKIQRKIQQIDKLEKRARDLQMRLWQIEAKWQPLKNEVRFTFDWKARCDKQGCPPDYTFGDLSC